MIIGIVILLLGIWQLWMTVRTFKNIKKGRKRKYVSFHYVKFVGQHRDGRDIFIFGDQPFKRCFLSA